MSLLRLAERGTQTLGRSFHTTAVSNHVIKLTKLRVVDNSELGARAMAEGKPPKVIHVYNPKQIGTIGKTPIANMLHVLHVCPTIWYCACR